MTHAARSVLVFSVYMIAMGLGLLLAPGALLGPFGVPAAPALWVRVSGLLTLYLGIYYMQAARREMTAFFRWTVPVRATLIAAFAAFVLAGEAPPVLALFGAIDLAGALWTLAALRRDARR